MRKILFILLFPLFAIGQTNLASDQLGTTISQFGVVADGIANNTTAIQAAFNAASTMPGKTLVFDVSGVANVTSSIDTKGCSIFGNKELTIVATGSAGNYANGVLYSTGAAPVLLTTTTTGSLKGAKTIDITSIASMLPGDLLVLVGPDGSWHPSQTYYRNAEVLLVKTAFEGVLYFDGVLKNPYPTGSSIYKISKTKSFTVQDLNIKGLGVNEQIPCFGVKHAVNVKFDGCNFYGGNYAGLLIENVIGGILTNCNMEKVSSDNNGLSYGLAISNAENLAIVGGRYAGDRHGISIGGGDVPWGYIARKISVVGAFIASHILYAADTHLNCADVKWSGCTIEGGINVSGADVCIDNCNITSHNTLSAINMEYIQNGTANISGGIVQYNRSVNNTSAAIAMTTFGLIDTTCRTGISFIGVKINCHNMAGTTTNFNPVNISSATDARILFRNVVIDCNQKAQPVYIASNMKSISFIGCEFNKCGIRLDLPNYYSIQNCNLKAGAKVGILTNLTSIGIGVALNNVVEGFEEPAMWQTNGVRATIAGNVFTNNNTSGGSTTYEETNLIVGGTASAFIFNNIIGGAIQDKLRSCYTISSLFESNNMYLGAGVKFNDTVTNGLYQN